MTATETTSGASKGWVIVLFAALLYTGVSFGLSAFQYRAMHVPHGDSAMYEEHLWNLIQGKGFRSHIDDGRLFLGEHFEVIHIFLVPIYWIFPSLLTLNLIESAGLASGALAVFALAVHFRAPRAATPLALAYLLYFPLHYLDHEITWKTFRPETLGVPVLLFMLLAVEKRRWGWVFLLVVLVWSAKEDYAVTTMALGVWIMGRGVFERLRARTGPHHVEGEPARQDFIAGGLLAGSSLLFLVFVLGWFIPYFRGGQPHYSHYFDQLGDSPREIVSTVVTQPALVFDQLTRPANGTFCLLLLLPLAGLSLLSPSRCAVALPALTYLMLSSRSELTQPWFHFHAPLIPIFFWSLAAGVARLGRLISAAAMGWVVVLFSLATLFWWGRTPLSWRFYDPAFGVPVDAVTGLFQPMGDYALDVYWPGPRSTAFAKVMAHVSPGDRIAATDYIRPRFTHFEANYVYPTLPRHIGIEDVDVIILDKKEGWWGRGPSNPDVELLNAMNRMVAVGTRIAVRGAPFNITHQDQYFLVARQVRDQETHADR